MMIFEIYGPDGRCKFSTKYAECILANQLDNMANAGYKFKLDGKIISLKQAKTVSSTAEISPSDVINEPIIAVPEVATMVKKPAIKCIETGQIFSKQSEAARAYNIDPAQVSDSIKTGRKRSGYTFMKVIA